MDQPVRPSGSSSLYPTDSVAQSNRQKLIWGLIALIGPTVLIIGSMVLYAIVHFASQSLAPASDTLFRQTSPIETIINVIVYLTGALSVLSFLPGIIVGIVLVATRR